MPIASKRVQLDELGAALAWISDVALPAAGAGIQRETTVRVFSVAVEISQGISETGRYGASHRASLDEPVGANLPDGGSFPVLGPEDARADLAGLDAPGRDSFVTNDAGAAEGSTYAHVVEANRGVYARAIQAAESAFPEIVTRAFEEALS